MTDITRDDLFEAVRYGKMTPAEAEAEASRLNVRPLAEQPRPESYDPMLEPFWTIAMAVAWIADRTPDAVREWWDAYRTDCWDWHFKRWRIGFDGTEHEGFFLEQRAKATLPRLQLSNLIRNRTAADTDFSMTAARATETLWSSLCHARLDATGIDQDLGRRMRIPAEEWHDLDYFEEDGRDVIRAGSKIAGSRVRYTDVNLQSGAVRRIWPVEPPAPLALPELKRPDGAGYMPLYCAAQWMATKGGAIEFEPAAVEVWRPVYDELLAHISAGEIAVVGVRDGARERVEGFHFAGCRVDYPFVGASFELALGDELYLLSFPYIDEPTWLGGFDDSLRNRNGSRWERLMVLKTDIARLWPFGVTLRSRTGAPGRPTSRQLVEAEFKERYARSELATRIGAEADWLSTWLRRVHPHEQQMTPKTVANFLRSQFQECTRARK